MSHEAEYTSQPAAERHRRTGTSRSPSDLDEVANIKYRQNMANARSYLQKIRSQIVRGPSSSSNSTGASLHDESRTSKTSRHSTPVASDLGSGGRPQRPTTSNRGGFSRSRLPLRPRNGGSLADVVNNNTISKDNTNGDEVRTAELLANMGKKIYTTRQQAKKLQAGGGEWRNKPRSMK